jgi:uncharacterized protein (TIGR03067 family)
VKPLAAYLTGVTGLIVLLAALPDVRVNAGGKDKEKDKDKDQAIPVVEFTKVYAEKPADFDKRYKGKTVTVEGVVSSTGVKLTARPGDKGPARTYLMMDGYKKPGSPVANMVRCEESGPDFEGVRAGHKVRIRGVAQAHSDTSVAAELRDCKVVKVFAADYPPSKAARAEVKKLQGAWKIIGAEANGKKLPVDQAGFDALTFSGYNVHLHQGKTSFSFGLALDPEKKPRTLDLVGNQVLPCIYALDDNKLRLQLPARGKDGKFQRPESFDTAQTKGHLLIAERRK